MARITSRIPRFVLDAGNAYVKYVCGSSESIFIHKIAMLDPSDYQDGMNRYGSTSPQDFIRVDGQCYVVGQTADYYNTMHRVGAPKYERDYYGPLFASAVARVFAADPELLSGGLSVVASHASRDYAYSANLIRSIKGRWDFECGGKRFKFTVNSVETYEEPFGGYCRRAFVLEKRQWQTPLHGYAVGVIDVGGGTCGTLQVDESGNVIYGAAASAAQGMNDVIARLKDALKREYAEFFGRGIDIPEKRLRQAISTGVYVGGGEQIDCSTLVTRAIAPLINEIKTMYTRSLNGGLGLDVLTLTGGGNADIGHIVSEVCGHKNTMFADDPASLQFANVRGAKTFFDVVDASI